MPDFRLLPLEQLIQACPPLLHVTSAVDRRAWHELQRRALAEQNPAAWDGLVVRLWSSMLFWIYQYRPELAPAVAEILAQRAMREFYRHYPYPVSHATLLAALPRMIRQVLRTSANG